MIDTYVREEIYFREGLALGLDKADEIVRRRIAQKFDFLQQDLAAPREPSEAQLRGVLPGATRHVSPLPPAAASSMSISPSTSAATPPRKPLPARAVARLAGGAPAEGDEFPGPRTVAGLTRDDLARLFGGQPFAAQLFAAPPGRWSGPFRSGFGWHVVRVSDAEPERRARWPKPAPRCARAGSKQTGRPATRQAYDRLRARYTVERADQPR